MHKYSHDENLLFSKFDQWMPLLEDIVENRNQFQVIAVYYFEILKDRKTEIMEKIKEYPTPVKSEMMSVADQIRYEGMEQGMEKTKILAIKNLINKGFDNDFISDVVEVSDDFIEAVRRDTGSQS